VRRQQALACCMGGALRVAGGRRGGERWGDPALVSFHRPPRGGEREGMPLPSCCSAAMPHTRRRRHRLRLPSASLLASSAFSKRLQRMPPPPSCQYVRERPTRAICAVEYRVVSLVPWEVEKNLLTDATASSTGATLSAPLRRGIAAVNVEPRSSAASAMPLWRSIRQEGLRWLARACLASFTARARVLTRLRLLIRAPMMPFRHG